MPVQKMYWIPKGAVDVVAAVVVLDVVVKITMRKCRDKMIGAMP